MPVLLLLWLREYLALPARKSKLPFVCVLPEKHMFFNASDVR